MNTHRSARTMAVAGIGVSMFAGTVWADVAYTNSTMFAVDTTIPEPAVLALVGLGLMLAARRWRRRDRGGHGRALLAALLIGGAAGTGNLRAAAPVITDVTAAQRPETMLCDIYYTAADADGGQLEVAVHVSTNGGVTYDVAATSLSGDIGYVTTGAHKHVVWDMGADFTNMVCDRMMVRVMVDDEMRKIPAGAFNMGTNNLPYESDMMDAGPNHVVDVSALYMSKYEVSYTLWTSVYTWALNHGYTFTNAGSGKAADHPVQTVNWYDCVKWCNARSEKEGLTPCYYLDAAQTIVYRRGESNLWNEAVKWAANGYRLPTEAEWEKAARGGLAGRRFPWYDLNITHTNANYYSSEMRAYDTSATRGYHPLFVTGGPPHTSPVGYFAANGYGLYDMAGNVWEWCWDWYDGWYYAASPAQDPCGPASGMARTYRGGRWSEDSSFCRAAARNATVPDYAEMNVGFRPVRR